MAGEHLKAWDGTGVQVPAVTLDQLLDEEGITRVNFLKMNIEGAEIAALQGMKQSICLVDAICVCCHDFRAARGEDDSYRTRDFVSKFLPENGFSIEARESDPRDYERDHLYGSR